MDAITPSSGWLGTRWRQFLQEREKIIERGSQTFVQVGTALTEIRDFEMARLMTFGTCRIMFRWW